MNNSAIQETQTSVNNREKPISPEDLNGLRALTVAAKKHDHPVFKTPVDAPLIPNNRANELLDEDVL